MRRISKGENIKQLLLILLILMMGMYLMACGSLTLSRGFHADTEDDAVDSSGENGDKVININNEPFDSSLGDDSEEWALSVVTIVDEDESNAYMDQQETTEAPDEEETTATETVPPSMQDDDQWDPDHTLSIDIPALTSSGLEMRVEGATGYASVSLPLWESIPGQGSLMSLQSIGGDGSMSFIFLQNSDPGTETSSLIVSDEPGAAASDPTNAETEPGSDTQSAEASSGETYPIGPGYPTEESQESEDSTSISDESTAATSDTSAESAPQLSENSETPPPVSSQSVDPYAGALTVLEPGTPYTILQESGDWWLVRTSSYTGWIESKYSLINLPDVVPSIIYNDTNSVSSIFKSSRKDIPGITGEQLYNCLTYNPRLGKDEYLMPVLYPMAKTIAVAQHNALSEGNTLVIYETYRPHDVQMEVAGALTSLASSDSEVRAGVSTSPWNVGWFIARNMSNHQRGFAMDVTLAKVTDAEIRMNEYYAYIKVLEYEEYTMPTAMHELSRDAATFTGPVNNFSDTAWRSAELSDGLKNNRPALALQRYCTEAGLSPLASEWWHFNDLGARAQTIDNESTGGYHITTCMSISVAEALSAYYVN